MDIEKIKTLVKQRGWTIKDFVEKIGLTQPGWNKAVNNNSLKVSTLEKIAQVLNVHVSAFFDEPEDKLKEISVLQEQITVYQKNNAALLRSNELLAENLKHEQKEDKKQKK